jgi:hypothetical protein
MSFHTGTISSVEFSVSLLQDDWILTELLSGGKRDRVRRFLVFVVGLCCLIAGHLTISWNSDGYGFNGFGRIVSLHWLLVFGGGLAAVMAFVAPIRYVVLISFGVAIGVSSGATPFFWRGILKSVRPKTG